MYGRGPGFQEFDGRGVTIKIVATAVGTVVLFGSAFVGAGYIVLKV